MTSIYEENVWAKVRHIHAEQMPLYNFIILRKKRDSNTCFPLEFVKLSGAGGCFWKQVTYYYVIKNYVGYKLAIFKAILFTLLHLLLTQWWDMRLKHDVAWLWEEQPESRNVCQNEKKYCSFRITLIRIDTILSNWYHYIYNNIQN